MSYSQNSFMVIKVQKLFKSFKIWQSYGRIHWVSQKVTPKTFCNIFT